MPSASLASAAVKHPCSVCKADIGWDAPSGVCSTECLNKGQGFTHAAAVLAEPSTTPKPCSTAELADALVDRILQVQRRHYRETGKKLSYADAITELGNLEDADLAEGSPEVMPTKRIDLEPVKAVLAGMHYSDRCNAAILETICRMGTVECGLKFLTAKDRAEIERAIPEAPEWADECWNVEVRTTGKAID